MKREHLYSYYLQLKQFFLPNKTYFGEQNPVYPSKDVRII